MAEAMGKSMFVAMVFISGMAATILLEKLMVLPGTCQVTGELMEGSGYRR